MFTFIIFIILAFQVFLLGGYVWDYDFIDFKFVNFKIARVFLYFLIGFNIMLMICLFI